MRATPGQVWTAGLAVTLSLTVVTFGLPPQRQILVQQAAPAAAPAVVDVQSAAPADVEQPPPVVSAPVDTPVFGAPVLSAPAPAPVPEPAQEPSAAPVPPPAVQALAPPDVLLLADASSRPPSRSDADMATAIAAARGIDARLVTADLTDPATCGLVPAGALVVTSFGVGPLVRDCLKAAGALLLGLDDGGLTPGDALSLSTGPGTTESLVETGAWIVRDGLATGQIGLVTTERIQPYVDDALVRMAADGLELAQVVYLPESGDGEAAVSDAVLAFSRAGITTVVFAAPVDLQRRWVLKASLVAPDTQYFVADTRDSILDEQYPPGFAGAMAHTVMRAPWENRANGDSARQAGCRADWTTAAPPAPLSEAEVTRAFAWCQHLALAADALAGLASGVPLAERLLATEVMPLLTTAFPWAADVGMAAQRVTVVWASDCLCWQQPVARRQPPKGALA